MDLIIAADSSPLNLVEHGIVGSVILLLFGLLTFLLKEHRAERKEWRTEASVRAAAHSNHLGASNLVQKELTVAVHDLSVNAKASSKTLRDIREDQLRSKQEPASNKGATQ